MDSKSIVVLIGGGHAAGKKTAAEMLRNEIGLATLLEVELVDLKHYETEAFDLAAYSGAASSAIVVNKEKQHAPLKPSRFDFAALKADINAKIADTEGPKKVYVVHGLYALYDKQLRDVSQLKVFIDSDPDSRLIRWIRRDVLDTPVTELDGVINAYLQGARTEMSNFIFPTKEFADVIMPRGAETNAVRLIYDGITPFLGTSAESVYPALSGNILRPSYENFDAQKHSFYELN